MKKKALQRRVAVRCTLFSILLFTLALAEVRAMAVELAGTVQGAGPVRTRRLRPPEQHGQVRIAQTFLDFRDEIVAKFDIDLAKPRLDPLAFELVSELLDELLVFRAVGKKDFHTVADPLGHIIGMDRVEGKTS
jgi:hypothetical protein